MSCSLYGTSRSAARSITRAHLGSLIQNLAFPERTGQNVIE